MKCVYLLQSVRHPDQYYTGITSDLKIRLKDHNEGRSPHTSKHVPWGLLVAVYFRDGERAHEFEKYLKTGSGRMFALRHFR